MGGELESVTFMHLVLWYNAIIVISCKSDCVGNTELGPILILGESQIPELKHKNIYIIRHRGLDPQTL